MGQHKHNPRAIMAQAGDLGGLIRSVTDYEYKYAFDVAIEPNKAKKAEIQAFLDAELASGKDPKDIDTRFKFTPEDQDYVVYHLIQQGRRLKVVDKIAVINIRGPEHFRMPLKEVMDRAQMAADGGPSEYKA